MRVTISVIKSAVKDWIRNTWENTPCKVSGVRPTARVYHMQAGWSAITRLSHPDLGCYERMEWESEAKII